MRTTVNPGRFLQLEGSFAVLRGDTAAAGEFRPGVVDRESLHEVTLEGLLRQFLEDPSETVTGPIRITIEPAS